MGTNCIKCQAILSPENWAPECQKNYINKCRSCIKTEKREYSHAWQKANRELSIQRGRRYKERLYANDPVRRRAIEAYTDARKRALRNSFPFNLTPSFVVGIFRDAEKCPYFGWELTFQKGKAKTLASLDRLDSNQGYTMDNVQVISYLANLMKSSASEEDLMAFALGVIKISRKISAPASHA